MNDLKKIATILDSTFDDENWKTNIEVVKDCVSFLEDSVENKDPADINPVIAGLLALSYASVHSEHINSKFNAAEREARRFELAETAAKANDPRGQYILAQSCLFKSDPSTKDSIPDRIMKNFARKSAWEMMEAATGGKLAGKGFVGAQMKMAEKAKDDFWEHKGDIDGSSNTYRSMIHWLDCAARSYTIMHAKENKALKMLEEHYRGLDSEIKDPSGNKQLDAFRNEMHGYIGKIITILTGRAPKPSPNNKPEPSP